MVQDQPRKITILLVDDHPLLRQALRDLLQKEADFEIVGEAGDGEEAVNIATRLSPDVIVMDSSLPKFSGIEATRLIKEKHPKVKVLALTVHDDDEHILETLQAGAAAYLLKSIFTGEIVQAIRAVVAGDMVLSPLIGQRILQCAARYPIRPVSLAFGEKLSAREIEVLRLTARGMSNKGIASALDISLRTVKGHLTDIFTKLRLGSRTEAVITGLRAGFLSLDDIQ
jgi:DNA-binding NarL/FixJ family response regulator